MLNKILNQELKVQNVYRRVNPSFYPKKFEKKNFVKNKKFLTNLYFNYLKLPIELFKNKSMLEFGSGTGEFSVNYLIWKMRADFVELNPLAIKKCKKYFKKFSNSKKFKIFNKSIFTFNLKKKYDFVSSIGVIHHTDYKKAFKIKSKFLKKNGFMMLGIGNSAGALQRNLQRFIIYYLASNNEKKMCRLAKKFFPEFLKRAQIHGRRSLDSIIYDNFINPKDFQPSTKEILNLAKKNKLTLYSSWPPLTPIFLSDSAQRLNENIQKFSNILSSNDIFSLVHKDDDYKKLNLVDSKSKNSIDNLNRFTKLINNIGSKKLPSILIVKKNLKNLSKKKYKDLSYLDLPKTIFTKYNYNNFFKELIILFNLLEKKNEEKIEKFLKKTKVLFKGNSGIGMNYYMFYKE